jgi:SAM-dependent methyltransferase
MVVHGFLEKQGEAYRCTGETAAFLDERSPEYQGAMTTFLNDPGFMRCFEDLIGAVRRGGTVDPGGGTVAAENAVWVEFARAMRANARAFAPSVAETVSQGGVPQRVLDVAAGHGIYGLELARRHPHCTVVFQDWESVLAVTRAHAQEAGLGARASYLPGDALTVAFPGRFDAILVTNFLHHFGREECARFLAKCRSALAPGGRVAVLEFALSEDRLSPARSAAFDLVMVATTRSGEAYTLSEYDPMFEAAGLERPTRHPLPEGTHVVLVAGAPR